jgi:cyclin H
MYYGESSHANKWLLGSKAQLNALREVANRRARDALSSRGASDDVVDGGPSTDDRAGATEDSTTGKGGVAFDDDGDAPPSSTTTGRPSSSSSSSSCDVYGPDDARVVPESTDASDNDGMDIAPSSSSCGIPMMDETNPKYGPTSSAGGDPLLSPYDEYILVSFYCSKIPLLIGPNATLPRCRRDAKVASTACAFYRRFYLYNSVMFHDPKSLLAACAFLAAKVEDCMISASYLEMGTREMNAPVPICDILDAEVRLIRGIGFELLVFSPYKTVLSYTEDMRTFLRTDRGAGLVTFGTARTGDDDRRDGHRRHGRGDGRGGGRRVELLAGEDLRPMHDAAMRICDDVIVSDVPLLFSPGEIGLAALMIANERVGGGEDDATTAPDEADGRAPTSAVADGEDLARVVGTPRIDIVGYVRARFRDASESDVNVDESAIIDATRRVTILGEMIREFKDGKHGCGNYGSDMDELKRLNKLLKKCRAWGVPDVKDEKRKKKKKRKVEDP